MKSPRILFTMLVVAFVCAPQAAIVHADPQHLAPESLFSSDTETYTGKSVLHMLLALKQEAPGTIIKDMTGARTMTPAGALKWIAKIGDGLDGQPISYQLEWRGGHYVLSPAIVTRFAGKIPIIQFDDNWVVASEGGLRAAKIRGFKGHVARVKAELGTADDVLGQTKTLGEGPDAFELVAGEKGNRPAWAWRKKDHKKALKYFGIKYIVFDDSWVVASQRGLGAGNLHGFIGYLARIKAELGAADEVLGQTKTLGEGKDVFEVVAGKTGTRSTWAWRKKDHKKALKYFGRKHIVFDDSWVVVSLPSLRAANVPGYTVVANKAKAELGTADDVLGQTKTLGEGPDAFEVVAGKSGPAPIWAWRKKDHKKALKYFGIKYIVFDDNWVVTAKKGLRAANVPGYTAVANKAKAELGSADEVLGQIKTLGEGPDAFEVVAGKSGRISAWAWNKKDHEKALKYFGRGHVVFDDDWVVASSKGLRAAGVRSPKVVSAKVSAELDSADKVLGQTKTLGEGKDAFEVVAGKSGPAPVWAWRKEDHNKAAYYFRFTIHRDPIEVIDSLDLASVIALIGDDPLRLTQWLRLYHPELSEEDIGSIVSEVIRGLRFEDPHKDFITDLNPPSIDVGDWDDVQEAYTLSVVGSEFELAGMVNPGIPFVRIKGADTASIEVNDDGTFNAMVSAPRIGINEYRIYAFDPAEKVKSPSLTLRVDADFLVVLYPPIIETGELDSLSGQFTLETDSSIFELKGKVTPGTPWLQVNGHFSRKVRVRKDGTFSVNLPLPDIGELNLFEVFAIDRDRESRSPSEFVLVNQTGEPLDIEKIFLDLILLRGDILDEIKKDPGRYRFLLRSLELSLLKYFTYSEAEGLHYLEGLIEEETSPTQKGLLKTVHRKFLQIKDEDYDLKPGEGLYFFQKYTNHEIRALLEEGATGVILANEQGLGKTVTILALLNSEPAVMIVPNAVVSTWIEQEDKFLPTANIETLEGSYREREAAIAATQRPQILTNVEFTRGMTKLRKKLLSNPNGVLVVDEADFMGLRSSQQARGTAEIEARFSIMATATPFKKISHLSHLLGMVRGEDSRFKSAKAFARAFPASDTKALNALFLLLNHHTIRIRKQDVFEEYDPKVPLAEQDHKLPKKKEIPPSEMGRFDLSTVQMESILELLTKYQEWNKKHKGLATVEDRRYHRYKEGFFPKKHALRQIMNDPAYIGRPDLDSPKHLAMDQIVEKELAKGPDRKVLIFAEYVAQVEGYLERYAKHGAVAYYGQLPQNNNGYLIDGDKKVLYFQVDEYGKPTLDPQGDPIPATKKTGRPMRALDYSRIRFQNNPDVRVMVANYQTGSVGVTFTGAHAVIFDDLAPTYRDQYQAGDRAHRIDNDRKKYEVTYYWLQARYPPEFLAELPAEVSERLFSMGTFDEVHYRNLQRQSRIFHRIMDGVGDMKELEEIHRRFMKEQLPFMFGAGEEEVEEELREDAEGEGRRWVLSREASEEELNRMIEENPDTLIRDVRGHTSYPLQRALVLVQNPAEDESGKKITLVLSYEDDQWILVPEFEAGAVVIDPAWSIRLQQAPGVLVYDEELDYWIRGPEPTSFSL